MSSYYVIGHNKESFTVRLDRAPRPVTDARLRFARHVTTFESDQPTLCRIWTGSEAFNMGDGRIVTPKRAAIELADIDLPPWRRIPMLCESANCVALSHMILET